MEVRYYSVLEKLC